MRIAHVVCSFPPYHGGIGNAAYHFARISASFGHEVTVFSPLYQDLCMEMPEVQSIKNMQVVRLLPAIQYGQGSLLPQLLWRLKDFSSIIFHYPFFGADVMVYLFAALTRYRGRLIVHYHMDVTGLSSLGKALSVPSLVIKNLLLRRANAIICASTDYILGSSISSIYERNPGKFVEIPYGVDLNRFCPRKGSSDQRGDSSKSILFVAGLDRAHYFKGVDVLLNAAARLPEGVGKWNLQIIGEGDLRPKYENLAQALGILDRVRFRGSVSDEELPSCYRQADLFVLPSINSNEAFGLVILEAMASGLPVIASNLRGVREVFREGKEGLLAQPGDVMDLGDKMTALLTKEDLRREMGVSARKLAEERYSWAKIGERLEPVLTHSLMIL